MIKKIVFILLVCGYSVTAFSQTLKDALSKKDTVAALALIKSGADINALDNYGSSVLMNACRWADDTIASFLLRHGATADKPKSLKGRTPLMVACAYYSGKGICKMLIEKGADVNATAQDGTTPLMLAAQNSKLDVVELLLQKGANPHIKDASGKSAYDYASKSEVTDYIKQSVKDSRIDKSAVMELLLKSMK